MAAHLTDPFSFTTFWGKARPRSSVVFHPAWAHGLDVAAAGRALLLAKPRTFCDLAARLDWTPEAFEAQWLHLLALHDLGKFSPLFQKKVDELYPVHLERPSSAECGDDPGHPKAGLLLITEWLDADDQSNPPLLRSWNPNSRKALLQPIFGHHGRPLTDHGDKYRVSDVFTRGAREAALAYWQAVQALLPAPPLDPPRLSALKAASWTIAGMTALADWIGSDQNWFPYVAADTPLPDYWDTACRQAEIAVREAGLIPAMPGKRLSFAELTKLPHAPTAAQAWAETVTLPDGPVLALIEDVTGGGKTEAALMLAHRLLSAGQADGIYFALPTMATANAMFDRMAAVAPRLFDEATPPSLALAHGRAELHPGFRRLRDVPILSDDGGPDDGDEPDAAVVAPAWLASESRKALLADFGIGTIDQGLLAVLPNRYGTVRLAGLARKVLIVDEAHAYDSYVGMELERLIAFHAASGGSTIVMSATLPDDTKAKMLDGWRQAIGCPAIASSARDYPLATLASTAGVLVEAGLVARPDLCRTLRITRVPDAGTAIAKIVAAAAAGACVAWIRNAVDDVIEGAEALREAGLAPDLFHARFAMGDRLDIERRVLCRFGKASNAEKRAGQVIVTSQVAEASLDVDWDLIVTDLAPVDSLLQRAGRLWRHTHRIRPISGPELVIVSPDPTGEVAKDWVKAAIPRAAAVYRDHGILWRTARELVARPTFRVPEDVRGVIEAVYARADSDIPGALERVRNEAIGRADGERSFAAQNLLEFKKGYQADGNAWQAEASVATRLVEDNRRVRLARQDGARLVPWRPDPDPRVAWALSEVTAYERKLKGRHRPEPRWQAAAATARSGWGRFEEDVVLLPLEQGIDGLWHGALVDEAGGRMALRYSERLGLML